MKSRQKNWRESRSRETEVGEKIAVTNGHPLRVVLNIPNMLADWEDRQCSGKGGFFSESAIRFSDLQISEKNIPKNYIDGVLLHCCLCLVVHTYLLKVQMGLQKREVSIFKINFLDEKCIIS